MANWFLLTHETMLIQAISSEPILLPASHERFQELKSVRKAQQAHRIKETH